MTASPTPGRRPHLDRITWITYLQLSLFAFFLYGFGATQALLRDEQGTSRTIASLHAIVFAAANVIAGLLIPHLMERWGRGRVIRYAVIVMSLGIAVYTAPFGLPASLIGTALVSCGGVSLVATANAFILDYQGSAGPAALTQANALAALFGFLVPLIIGLTTALAWGWRTGLWALIVALLVTELLRSGLGPGRPSRGCQLPAWLITSRGSNYGLGNWWVANYRAGRCPGPPITTPGR